jgi:uncharacterized protein (DUF736 family)
METQKTSNSQSNSEQKVQCWRHPDFKLYGRAITIKIAWYWHKNRQEDLRITIEDLDINPHIYRQLIFNKGTQNTRWRKDSPFNTAAGKTGYPHVEDCTKINSEWIKDLNIRPETLKQP